MGENADANFQASFGENSEAVRKDKREEEECLNRAEITQFRLPGCQSVIAVSHSNAVNDAAVSSRRVL